MASSWPPDSPARRPARAAARRSGAAAGLVHAASPLADLRAELARRRVAVPATRNHPGRWCGTGTGRSTAAAAVTWRAARPRRPGLVSAGDVAEPEPRRPFLESRHDERGVAGLRVQPPRAHQAAMTAPAHRVTASEARVPETWVCAQFHASSQRLQRTERHHIERRQRLRRGFTAVTSRPSARSGRATAECPAPGGRGRGEQPGQRSGGRTRCQPGNSARNSW